MTNTKPLITRRWFQWLDLLFMPFATMPFFFGSVAMLVPNNPNSKYLFLIALVTTPIPYWLLARLFNSAKVHLIDNTCEVSHGPIPWPGLRLTLQPKQLFEVGIVSSGRTGRRYGVVLNDSEGRKQIVLKADSTEQAENFSALLNEARH